MLSLQSYIRSSKSQQGLSLIELLIALLIGLFLLGGLGILLQNTRAAFGDQNQLALLQDSERMAMTMITDVIQQGGYFPDPTTNTAAILGGDSIAGTYSATAPGDTITVRYRTATGENILNCSGTSNNTGADVTYVNVFSVNANRLVCVMNGTVFPLVSGLQSLSASYGVRTDLTAPCANCVDTYMNATEVTAAGAWANVLSVMVTLTFTNPLYTGSGPQPQTIAFQRVVNVMNKSGIVL